MRCRKAQEWLSLWMDARLEAHQEQRLLEHIQQCEHCQRVALQWERLRGALRAYPQIAPSAGFDLRVWQAVREQRQLSAWWQQPLAQLSFSAVAAVTITLCLLTAMWLNTPRQVGSSERILLIGGQSAQMFVRELLGGEGGIQRWHDGSSSRSSLPLYRLEQS